MGLCQARPKQETYKSAQVNIFEEQSSDLNRGKTASASTDDTTDQSTGHSFDLNAEYTFFELYDSVFELGRDCIVDDVAGAICGRIESVNRGRNCFGVLSLHINLKVIKSNGEVFFRSDKSTCVTDYPGKLKLSELPIRPVLEREKNALRERGRLFVAYGVGAHYLTYSDKMFIRGCYGTAKVSAEGRAVVDTSSFLHFNPNYASLQEGMHLGQQMDAYERVSVCGQTDGMSSTTVPEGSLHLCWPTLCGFSLKTKRWGEFAVDALKEINFCDEAFNTLVMDPKPKTLVKSLVENVHRDMFTDVIHGKGGGCVFLLHGPPGTGKTLTAEAVSETLQRPLYCVDVGELGITPDALENKLRDILEVAQRWNAVVLIDECDIFLAKRNGEDIRRNAMVGIFLRLLEYYDGVLFLTSNRVDELDEAFQSRISISLEYNDLDQPSREKVWINLMRAAGVEGINAEELGGYDLNGRQIKTAIRLALSLAQSAGEPINSKHLVETISYTIGTPSGIRGNAPESPAGV